MCAVAMLVKCVNLFLCKAVGTSIRPQLLIAPIICPWRQQRTLFTMEEVEKGFREDVNLAAVCQMTSTKDKDANLRAGSYLVERAVKMGAKVGAVTISPNHARHSKVSVEQVKIVQV